MVEGWRVHLQVIGFWNNHFINNIINVILLNNRIVKEQQTTVPTLCIKQYKYPIIGMKQKLPIIVLTCLTLTLQLPQICKQIAKDLPRSSSLQPSPTKSCFKHLIERGEYESLDKLEQSLNDQQQSIMAELLASEITRLKSIEEYVVLTHTRCEPVLKWAQNHTHIFLAIKLSHRWDSPPCLKTVHQHHQLLDSVLNFTNVCLVSKAKIRFQFVGKLYAKVQEHELLIKKDGVGTYSLVLQKLHEEIWPYVFENEKLPLWQEMMNNNISAKKEYENLKAKTEAASASAPKVNSELNIDNLRPIGAAGGVGLLLLLIGLL